MHRWQQSLLSFYSDCAASNGELRDVQHGKGDGHKYSKEEQLVCNSSEKRVPGSHCPKVGCVPFIPGIKRIRENDPNAVSQDAFPPSEPVKRKKFLEELGVDGLEKGGAWDELSTKFEWLQPSKIRDAKGRTPSDPFFDKRTVQIPPNVLSKMTASQKQYWETKSQYMDTIIFFKVGKFYELYEMDAEIGHRMLGWKMTVSGVGKCRQVGVPESGIEDAVQKLLSLGYKVGRMEQMETAKTAKVRGPGEMVQRKLIHILTPSTVIDGHVRPEAVHLLALQEVSEDSVSNCTLEGGMNALAIFGFAFVDAAAGQFFVGSLCDDSSRTVLGALLKQVAPLELLYEMGGLSNETWQALRRYKVEGFLTFELTPLQPNLEFMDASDAISMIKSRGYFRNHLDGGHENQNFMRLSEVLNATQYDHPAASALGALVSHLSRIKLDAELLKHGFLNPYEVYKGSMQLDGQTLSNLEIFNNKADGDKAGTLIAYLDNCATYFGKRLLRRWICHPLQSIKEINDRLDAVDEFMNRSELADHVRTLLCRLPDLERLVAHVRGFVGSVDMTAVPVVGNQMYKRKVKTFCSTVKGLLSGFDALIFLKNGDSKGAPHAHILQTASLLSNTKHAYDLLRDMASYIDSKLSSTSMTNVELDKLVACFEDKDTQYLNQQIVLLNEQNRWWSSIIQTLAQVDVLVSFAAVSHGANGSTCRPHFVQTPFTISQKGEAVLNIRGLWHPLAVGGQGGVIVPNDVVLGCPSDTPRALLLTGPNMGGKSTLLRATCLVVILAQLGCHVPAESCILSPVDIIFTRLGASDRILCGESTFMVECMEAASILRHATGSSLVVLDELGRGTSTFDGYAIAYAVLRHLVDTLDCRILFATHYHPLTKEFGAHPSIKLQHMAFAFEPTKNCKGMNTSEQIDEEALSPKRNCQQILSTFDKQLVFLYKLTSGSCPASYGLQVALLAGLPISTVKAAERAASRMRTWLSSSFVSIDYRQSFSHIHEKWLKTILSIANSCNSSSFDDVEDAYDTALCLWHELHNFEKSKKF